MTGSVLLRLRIGHALPIGPKPCLGIVGHHRPRIKITLRGQASLHQQNVALGFGLDALGDHCHPQALTDPNDRAGQGTRGRFAHQPRYEAAIDLQLAHRHPLQMPQARIARTEIVHLQTHVALGQCRKIARGLGLSSQHNAFRHL